MNNEQPPEYPEALLPEPTQPFWTPWRIIYAIIAIIVIIAFLATVLWPLLTFLAQPPPPPTESLPRV